MARASGVQATLVFDRGAPVQRSSGDWLVDDGVVPGRKPEEPRRMPLEFCRFESRTLTPEEQLILADAQTSGGLLIAVDADRADSLVRELSEKHGALPRPPSWDGWRRGIPEPSAWSGRWICSSPEASEVPVSRSDPGTAYFIDESPIWA